MNTQQFTDWCHQSFLPVISTSPYLRKPLIMGVLNVTPNSFSDGGFFLDIHRAYARVQEMLTFGVDIIDIGGESTKPGADSVSSQEEMARVIPLIELIRAESDICISIDTSKADVMQAAIAAGASWINDVNALNSEDSLAVASSLKVPVCLMHRQGCSQTMQDNPHYQRDVIDEINVFFKQRIEACLNSGIPRTHLILDPGFGFGKSVDHNLRIMKCFSKFQVHGFPLLLGVSRKSTIGAVLQRTVFERLTGGIAAAVFAALQGVSIIRTHDVDETSQALKMVHAMVTGSE